VTTAPDGADAQSSIAHAMVTDDTLLRRVILGFADDVEVLGPPSLRQYVGAVADRTARRYRTR
jgi:hypothetical protein